MSGDASEFGPWRYVWRDVPRPFVHPVRTPAGHVISRDAPEDHWWHHALWFAIKFVNGENFWEEYDEFGLLSQAEPPELHDATGAVGATSRLRWVRPDGRTTVIDQTTVHTHRHLDDAAHALDWDVRLRPTMRVELDRTPFTTWGGYGGLAFRGRGDWHDTYLRLPGRAGRDRVLGDRADWLSLEGPVATGDEPSSVDPVVGMVLMDHPENPSYPTPWYASTRAETYGSDGWSNFCNAAFLWEGPLVVEAGDECRLRHRVIVHDGPWSSDRIGAQWTRWLQEVPG